VQQFDEIGHLRGGRGESERAFKFDSRARGVNVLRRTRAGGVSAERSPESGVHHAADVVRRASHALIEAAEELVRPPEPPASWWHRAGIGRRGERIFNVLATAVLLLLAGGWGWSVAMVRAAGEETATGAPAPAAPRIAAALTEVDAPSAAYLTDLALGALTPLRGESGKLRAHIQPVGASVPGDSLPSGTALAYSRGAGAAAAPASAPADTAPAQPGIWQIAVRVGSAIKPVTDFNLITLTPRSAKQRGRIGLYYIGSWPGEGRGNAPRPGYTPPAGFIEVTRENQDTRVSEHFRLRDFLTHDQQNVWPKYLVLQTRLIDKLELVLADLEARGHDVRGVRVMSGFRTPQYNASGGDPRGRAGLSRHMYGDAADVFLDSDGNGSMDDLNGDGRVNINDARVIQAAVDRVEAGHPALVGGSGVYVGGSGHGPFIHIDTRGYRSRWVGTGDS
jgi:hypothetical protein